MLINFVMSSKVKSKIFDDITKYFKKYSNYQIVQTLKPLESADLYYYFRPHLEVSLKFNSIVTVHHDLDDADKNLSLKLFLDRYKEAKLVICLNTTQENILHSKGIMHTIIIPHGYNHSILQKKKKIIKKKIVFGFFSSHYPRLVKGEDYLIKLFSSKLLNTSRYKFILIGKKRSILAKELNGLGFECEVYETLPYKFFNILYQRIDCLLITSKHEGGPASLPESLATCTPVVTTKVGMANDFTYIDGVKHLSGDINDDIKIIQSLRTDLNKLIVNTCRQDAKLLTWEKVVSLYDNEFAKLSIHRDKNRTIIDNLKGYYEQYTYYVNTLFLKKKIQSLFIQYKNVFLLLTSNYPINYSSSKQLISNTKNFIDIKYYSLFDVILNKKGVFCGWGRKKSGLNAVKLAKKHHTSFVLLEDGFIRSIGLGIDGSPSFSLIEDDVGIYYDATAPNKLENILNTYDFTSDTKLMADAERAIELIRKHHISKYNNATLVDNAFCKKYKLGKQKSVLVIAQTAGDASLKYGMLDEFGTDEMIEAAIAENPDAKVYLKIHPDVLSGKKNSDIDIAKAKERCIIIEENINPISLLKHFHKVYTKTSGMGFEALLCGCECVCFGMPFYAGWGITDDRSFCPRRKTKRTVKEVFAAAYILYTRYYNPYKKRPGDIFDVINEIRIQRNKLLK